MTVKDIIKILSTLDGTMKVEAEYTRDLSRKGFDILDISIRILKPIKEE